MSSGAKRRRTNRHVPKEGADLAELIVHRILLGPYSQRNSIAPITAGIIIPARNTESFRPHWKGITQQLIAAAVEYARSKGAKVVEAYPAEPDSPSYRFMGFVSSYKAVGFHEVGRVGNRRYIYRLELS